MSEKQRSEDLWMRFLDGNVSEEENERLMRLMAEDDALLEEYLAVNESLKRIDSQPLVNTDLRLAQKQIDEALKANGTEKENAAALPHRTNIRKYLAIAAAVALLIGVALFFLFRPGHNENNLAKQEKPRVEKEAKPPAQSPEISDEQEPTDKTLRDETSSATVPVSVPSAPVATEEATFSSQKLEKNYAAAQTANRLTVTKPSKDNYRVLCKNLEKSLDFEWEASNVQTLHFSVTDSKGKSLVETKDAGTNRYSLKYRDIYPEKRLAWCLVVVHEDGTQEKRNGEIIIDYDL